MLHTITQKIEYITAPLLLPGYLSHELFHILLCSYYNGNIIKSQFRIFDNSELVYNSITDRTHIRNISLAPLLNNVIVVVLFAVYSHTNVGVYAEAVIIYLITTLLLTSIPSTTDINMILMSSNKTTITNYLLNKSLPILYYYNKYIKPTLILSVILYVYLYLF